VIFAFFAARFIFSQMRHDLLGTDIQMFHLVEHRIENDLLRSGFDDLLDFFRALRFPIFATSDTQRVSRCWAGQ
jgi:hypothetical protein